MKIRVSEIRVKRICVNQGLGVAQDIYYKKTDPDLRHLHLCYGFLGHNESVGRGTVPIILIGCVCIQNETFLEIHI